MRSFLAAIGLSALAVPALSAEQISFQFGELERSIPIAELAGFAAGDPPGAKLREVLR